jgi:hypothetical protein
MNLLQLEEIKTEVFYWVEFHIGTEPNSTQQDACSGVHTDLKMTTYVSMVQ